MFANQRQGKIKEMIITQGAVNVSELIKLFGVSIETVRKDLLILEQAGALKRVHGGAVRSGEMKKYDTLSERNAENIELKKELSLKAVDFIKEGDFVAIDAGSTATLFAKALKERFNALTVVTHSKDVFDILCDYAQFDVILCAGHYLKEERAFFGDLAQNTLNQLHVQKAFIFVSAISIEYGVFDFQKELLNMQKGMIRAADEIYILADNTKFEKTGLLKLCDMEDAYTYITDSGLSSKLKEMYLNNGIKIV